MVGLTAAGAANEEAHAAGDEVAQLRDGGGGGVGAEEPGPGHGGGSQGQEGQEAEEACTGDVADAQSACGRGARAEKITEDGGGRGAHDDVYAAGAIDWGGREKTERRLRQQHGEEYDEPEIRLTVLSQTTHPRRTVYEEERALDTAGPKKAAPGKPRAAGMSGYIELFGKPGNINGILACRIANNLYVPPFGRQLLITAAFFKASNPCAF